MPFYRFLVCLLSLAVSTTALAATATKATMAPALSVKDVATKVAVAGATGRTGRYVVQELLAQDVPVVAMVRTMEKAEEVFADYDYDTSVNGKSLLQVVVCDLADEKKIQKGKKVIMTVMMMKKAASQERVEFRICRFPLVVPSIRSHTQLNHTNIVIIIIIIMLPILFFSFIGFLPCVDSRQWL